MHSTSPHAFPWGFSYSLRFLGAYGLFLCLNVIRQRELLQSSLDFTTFWFETPSLGEISTGSQSWSLAEWRTSKAPSYKHSSQQEQHYWVRNTTVLTIQLGQSSGDSQFVSFSEKEHWQVSVPQWQSNGGVSDTRFKHILRSNIRSAEAH